VSSVSIDIDSNATTSSTHYLILGDGTRLAHPEDLVPVVEPDSATARAAGRYVRGRKRGGRPKLRGNR